jgi:hypothetical protein
MRREPMAEPARPQPSSQEDEFDVHALFDALDRQRVARGLSWRGVATEIWEQSAELNKLRHDHRISPSTLTSMPSRSATSCQHALFMLRWLGRAPEEFVPGVGVDEQHRLPAPGPDRRLRWSLRRLYEDVDLARRERGLTWAEAAVELRCSTSQLTGIRTARYAIGMTLAMRIVRWLGRPAVAYIYPAKW